MEVLFSWVMKNVVWSAVKESAGMPAGMRAAMTIARTEITGNAAAEIKIPAVMTEAILSAC